MRWWALLLLAGLSGFSRAQIDVEGSGDPAFGVETDDEDLVEGSGSTLIPSSSSWRPSSSSLLPSSSSSTPSTSTPSTSTTSTSTPPTARPTRRPIRPRTFPPPQPELEEEEAEGPDGEETLVEEDDFIIRSTSLPPKPKRRGLSWSWIIGIIVAASLLLIVLVTIAVVCCLQRRQRRQREQQHLKTAAL